MDLVTEQKLERRQRILETARALIGERGYRGVTMRELASSCRVSVPTLYNLFGGKNELLAAAVESHLRSLLAGVPARTGRRGHRRALALIEQCGKEVAREPSYHRSLIEAFAGARETGPLQVALTVELSEALSGALAEMQGDGHLEAWADCRLMAGHMTAACISASVVWAMGGLGDDALGASMVYAACMMLLGVAIGPARREIERRARAAQRTLAADAAGSRARPGLAGEAAAI